MFNTRPWFFALFVGALLASPLALAHKAKKSARIYFVEPADTTVVQSPVRLRFGAENIPIAAVGVDKHRSGHHHLLINVSEPASMEDVIPYDEQHIHYVNGETEAEIHLPPGRHSLQLVLGDEEHLPWGEMLVSRRIEIEVVADQERVAQQ